MQGQLNQVLLLGTDRLWSALVCKIEKVRHLS
jgi:hypothetical protein